MTTHSTFRRGARWWAAIGLVALLALAAHAFATWMAGPAPASRLDAGAVDASQGGSGAAGAAPRLVLVALQENGGASPDGMWQTLPAVQLPDRFPAPTAFVPLTLNEQMLETRLRGTPRETFGPIPPQTQIYLPRASGGFVQISLAQSQLLEPGLASQYPQIRTYVFEDEREGFTGHITVGTRGVFISGQTDDGILRVEPVETADGRVYLSYRDQDRTDGANDFHQDHDDHEPVPVPRFSAQLVAQIQANAMVEAGTQLRIYRLAASTTGEFFQARDAGGGQADVLSSIVADVAGANAVFEPEVSVRLVVADASEDVMYSDPDTDPFDNTQSPCTLRDANRDNNKVALNDADYDIGFLFATRAGGGASGCAWFVVCLTTDDTLHKGRGAGQMGNNGMNSASGLLAHEVGHQLGARHTFTGSAGSCTLVEFNAGDSESGYEPGSGTTRMSYNGNCGTDDVDTSVVGAGSYFHSRSFDEIVTNVFSGDGATCGTLVNTTNSPPSVDAGADYTIPRQTPFELDGSATDADVLTYNWEQYDRAVTQRPINTDPGDGPIVRSVPPGASSARIIPNLQDLLDGITRAGEILPQVDRELNFRLIARDNRMGGGGVAYDSMQIQVVGDPFFILSPNSGSLAAGCSVPLTWQVGGGSVAPQVSALFSSDGGQNFTAPLVGPTANDGASSFVVPCSLGSDNRIKLQSVDNIFFDINDEDLTVTNTPPSVEVSTAGGAVDNACEFTVQFTATATDTCGVLAGDVDVDLIKGANNFTLGTPTINVQQVSSTQVDVSGSVVVSGLLSSPAQLTVSVTAQDACGASTNDTAVAQVVDDTPPTIAVSLDPDRLWPPNHKMEPVWATVVATDNCPVVNYALTSIISDEPDNGVADGNTVDDIQNAAIGTPDLQFDLRAERAGNGDGRVYTATYTAVDGSGNDAQDSATVEVPKNNN
ncbi:reprolysin-like metallopeptidase [Lysobacter sp. M15]|uniref:reprolysin-like metallopeptidase n=1 Tax=Lysobacter sp. M15 TaxID=2916837 RepID=UPI001F57E751|nr:zinc-dependent metalloprotease family protein [Lysobacter sp. M15]